MPTSSGFGLKNYGTTKWISKSNKNFNKDNKSKVKTTVSENKTHEKKEDDDYATKIKKPIVTETKQKILVPISKSVTKANPKKTQTQEKTKNNLKKHQADLEPKEEHEIVGDLNNHSISSSNRLMEPSYIDGYPPENEINTNKIKELKFVDTNSDTLYFTESSFSSDTNSKKKLISKEHKNKLNSKKKEKEERRFSDNSFDDKKQKGYSKKGNNKLNSRDTSFTKSYKKIEHTKTKKHENDIISYQNASIISFSSESSIADDTMKIDPKGDLNFYITQEKNNNDEIDKGQLKELPSKIMKKNKNININDKV
jgi:hypothetical protein